MAFGSIYLTDISISLSIPELGVLHLTKFLKWGIDGYFIILAVKQLALLGLFIYWLKKKKMLYIFEKKGFKEVKILLPCSWFSDYLFSSSIGG